MNAFRLYSYDGPGALRCEDAEEPSGDDSCALVDVAAIGVNFPDLLLTQGKYQLRPDLPCVPGCEIAGVVRWAPPGSGWAPGDRVAAFIWQGGFAEVAAVPLAHLVRVGEAMTFDVAAALLVNYHTVHFALARRGRVTAGETVLVLGAAGGIGSAGVQVARGLGARVIAGVASTAQASVAERAGAADVVLLERGFSARVRAMAGGRGVDAVLDPLGDWLFTEAARALAPEGRILVVGFAAGEIPLIKANRLLLNNISAVGVAWGAFIGADPGLLAAQAAALNQMFAAGSVRPPIGSRFTFSQLPEALMALQAGRVAGKAVVQLHGG
jgi:NADPH2:quinone reductase